LDVRLTKSERKEGRIMESTSYIHSQEVTLKTTDNDGTFITGIKLCGIHVLLEDANDKNGGTYATFSIENKDAIFSLSLCPGRYNEYMNITWSNGEEHPRLEYRKHPQGCEAPEEQTFKVRWYSI
jgi:hypothetical protein